ncbi:MAG: hypothetical protein ABS61_00570 [Microbacterium sp. SCN 70-18]|nr:hypothetical protein [Microbacterium chocolatum]ODT12142.1 MAG: hypothetical protein ABS61_00570 [Microbacterium sp. SCN 70-18]
MHEVFVGDRSVAVTHIKTEPTEYGDIQRYRANVSGFDASTRIAILRADSAVDARVLAVVVDSELLLGYKGSEESGLLRDPALRAWRDEHRNEIKELLQQLHCEADALPPEPVTEAERMLLRAFDMDGDLDDA